MAALRIRMYVLKFIPVTGSTARLVPSPWCAELMATRLIEMDWLKFI
jgi:hypothetical protein